MEGAEAGDKAGPPVLGKGPWEMWAPGPLPAQSYSCSDGSPQSQALSFQTYTESQQPQSSVTQLSRGKDPRRLTPALTLRVEQCVLGHFGLS